MNKSELPYLVALSLVEGLGPVRLKILLNHLKSPKEIWNLTQKDLEETGLSKLLIEKIILIQQKIDPISYFQSLGKRDIQVMTCFDENYPVNLKNTSDWPVLFYYKGEILPTDRLALAVVGARKMTSYGRWVTENLTAQLVKAGLTIVSGLARGVDSCAHQTAMAAGGRTLAVLGGGIERIYPPENMKMAEEIIGGKGAVISEFPPEMNSMPGNFPARNRIISGLSLGVLVTEAAIDSGSLITANLGAVQGREVFAVPGPITSVMSGGTADLIKNGAKLVCQAADILEELNLEKKFGGENLREQEIIQSLPVSKEEEIILGLLENERKHIDQLVRESGLKIEVVNSLLMIMEIQGRVRKLDGGEYIIA